MTRCIALDKSSHLYFYGWLTPVTFLDNQHQLPLWMIDTNMLPFWIINTSYLCELLTLMLPFWMTYIFITFHDDPLRLSFRMINTFIYLSERLTSVTFLDDRRGTSSGGGITVTSGDLGLLSRKMGGASGRISSVCPRGVFSLGDNIGSSISFNPSFVLDGEKRLIKASDPFNELQCFKHTIKS